MNPAFVKAILNQLLFFIKLDALKKYQNTKKASVFFVLKLKKIRTSYRSSAIKVKKMTYKDMEKIFSQRQVGPASKKLGQDDLIREFYIVCKRHLPR